LKLGGAGQIGRVGQVFSTGGVRVVGFHLDRRSSGRLKLRDASGTITLKVTGATAGRDGRLPGTFSYRTESGTGAYARVQDSGTLTLSLDPSATRPAPHHRSHGRFSLALSSAHCSPTGSIASSGAADGSVTSTQGPPDTGTPGSITLSGEADGSDTATYGDTWRHDDISASGTITPIGAATVSGSFDTPPPAFTQSSGSGTLTIVGSQGTLTLALTVSTAGGGATGGGATFLFDFTYTITGGTGLYAKDRGSGTVVITTTPGLTGPGNDTGSGQTTVTFGLCCSTLSGEADGSGTFAQGPPDSGTQYDISASGTITPIGAATVSGSFGTPGFIAGVGASGTLTIVGSQGTLTLALISSTWPADGLDFTYTITGGTGPYAKDHGSGTVVISITPGPTGPGNDTGFGQTTVTFGLCC
jgi:hypothetical protein